MRKRRVAPLRIRQVTRKEAALWTKSQEAGLSRDITSFRSNNRKDYRLITEGLRM
jgi:hypothetical protein